MTGSVGAPTRTRKTNDNNTGNREIQHGTGTCINKGSVERAHDSAGCGYTGRKKCAGKRESDRFCTEVSCNGGSVTASEPCLSGSG
jgi:hypothetical protein